MSAHATSRVQARPRRRQVMARRPGETVTRVDRSQVCRARTARRSANGAEKATMIQGTKSKNGPQAPVRMRWVIETGTDANRQVNRVSPNAARGLRPAGGGES